MRPRTLSITGRSGSLAANGPASATYIGAHDPSSPERIGAALERPVFVEDLRRRYPGTPRFDCRLRTEAPLQDRAMWHNQRFTNLLFGRPRRISLSGVPGPR